MADGVYKCHDCHMTFDTLNLLQKHKRKFCVGSVGDPDSLLLRKGLRSEEDRSPRPISPDDRDYPRYNVNQDAQLRQLAEDHGRNMEYLQLKNRDLEKQKEDIRRRLLELGTKGRPTGDNTSELLAELRAQEARNAKALADLKQHLYDMKHQRVNVIEYERQQPQQAPPPPVETGRKSYIYPVYFGNSLVAEISAMKQAYLQNGGNDPDVLAQMAQMLAEAQNIEDSMKRGEYDNRHREKKGTNQIQYLDMENERLHKELLLLQQQNFMARERRKTDREEELERQMRRIQEDHLRKLLDLQNEIAMLKNRAMMENYKPPEPPTARLPPPPPNNADTPWLLQRPYVEVEQMVPYDQYPNRYVPTNHHTWVATQHYKSDNRLLPPTARPTHDVDIDSEEPE